MIEGVWVKKLNVISDERGRLMEMLRCDDDCFRKFGQVYLTTAYPGVVKAWHYHKKQCDNFCVVRGMLKLVLYDNRNDSPTHGEINEFFLGPNNPILVGFEPLIVHGFKGVGTEEALVINCVSEPYRYDDPDEYRIDPHDNGIPYDWTRKDG